MTEKEAEAKQLDSVTDRVAEQEVDISKAQMAMSSLDGPSAAAAATTTAVTVSAADCKVIMDELEVTEDVAAKVLRHVASFSGVNTDDHDAWVAAALRHLITQAP